MSEKSFFEKTGPYKLKILSDHINGKLSSLENSDVLIDDISSLKNAKDSEITFFSNLAYKKDLKEIGSKLAMHIAAQAPIAIDESGIEKEVLNKELEIIKEELKNSGKKTDMIEKIANGKIKKFVSDNTLLNQIWIMDTKMKVNQIIKQYSDGKEIKVLDFVRFKVGEGID